VTAMSCASSSSLKRKRKRNSKEKKYKTKKNRKINKRKMLVSKHSITVCSEFILSIEIHIRCM